MADPPPNAELNTITNTRRYVPIALAHATGRYSLIAEAVSSRGPSRGNVYGEWSALVSAQCQQHLVPKLGLHLSAGKRCLIHAQGSGKPE